MLLRANNRSGYMRSKPWCFCLSLLFSSLSNKIAHTAASTLRADFIYKLAAASWLCHRLLENADRSCNNSVPLHKKNKRISPQLSKMDRQRRPTWPSPALSPWRLMMSMRMSTTMMVPVLPMPALWEHQARVKRTQTTRGRGSLELKLEPPRICWVFFFTALYEMRFDVGEKSAAPPPQ